MTTTDHDFRNSDQLKALFRDQQHLINRLAQDSGSYQRYLADLIATWNIADAETRQQLQAGKDPTSLADCIRLALTHSTIVGNLRRSYSLPSVYSNGSRRSDRTAWIPHGTLVGFFGVS